MGDALGDFLRYAQGILDGYAIPYDAVHDLSQHVDVAGVIEPGALEMLMDSLDWFTTQRDPELVVLTRITAQKIIDKYYQPEYVQK